ncbi:MAG: hypothetical protein U0835_10455 [Isosphaeraceae bacterium]
MMVAFTLLGGRLGAQVETVRDRRTTWPFSQTITGVPVCLARSMTFLAAFFEMRALFTALVLASIEASSVTDRFPRSGPE